MQFSTKLSLIILISGITVLCLFASFVFIISSDTVKKSQFKYTQALIAELSDDINQILLEKVKTARTLANTPIIKKALESSNLLYAGSPEKRDESIKLLNEKWKSITSPEDKFILKFTDNKVSRFLKNQQVLFPEEYGEIFLTNQFGALVASTSKLSTFAHGYKYWWIGAYNNGDGKVFFDDRGYDDSAGGYVLGLVIPVKKDSRIIGVLKLNLNILGAVNKLLSGSMDEFMGKFKLSRSNGMIVFEEGFEPLSTQLPAPVRKNIKEKNNSPFFLKDSDKKYLVGFSEIAMTKEQKGYGFGGIFESIDHKKGNTGESWYVINFRPEYVIQAQSFELIKWIVLIGSVIIFFLTSVSYFLGKTMTKPLRELKKATKKIGAGDFKYKIDLKQFDNEFKDLASSFNIMTTRLLQTTTSIKLLENEINDHKKSKAEMMQHRLFLESLLGSSKNMIIFSLDLNSRYYFLNKTHAQTMEHVFGTQPEVGDYIFDFIKGKDEIIKAKDHYKRALAGESHTEIEEYVQDKKRYYYEFQYNPMYNQENQIIGVTSFAQNITKRLQYQRQIEISLKEKEVLLSEIHHRVKNNMQVIISMLRLQSNKTDNKEYVNLLKESERRVFSMSLVHEQLYQSGDFLNIDFNKYLNNLLTDLFIAHGVDTTAVELIIECSDVLLDLDNAIPCGLIVNELASNCLKHAFPDNRKGKITIFAGSDNEDKFELTVSDDGVGISKDLEISDLESMGLHLVRVLVEDTFEGTIESDSTKGTRFHLKLKKLKYRQRI